MSEDETRGLFYRGKVSHSGPRIQRVSFTQLDQATQVYLCNMIFGTNNVQSLAYTKPVFLIQDGKVSVQIALSKKNKRTVIFAPREVSSDLSNLLDLNAAQES